MEPKEKRFYVIFLVGITTFMLAVMLILTSGVLAKFFDPEPESDVTQVDQ